METGEDWENNLWRMAGLSRSVPPGPKYRRTDDSSADDHLMADSREAQFQQDIIDAMVAGGC